ncbi:MAG: glycosyltransferase family 2 protein [Anaerolineaceae bacterium]|nr:glycosyltransferase family 2 protein [Anaerolineaceae bacterium]
MEFSAGKVSIMMPVFNGEKYIESAIQSILDQTFHNWELIVVNDGSTDHTPTILEKFQDYRIKIIHQKNQGEAVARNTALKSMDGEFLSFLDADDLYFPEFLDSMVCFLSNQPKLMHVIVMVGISIHKIKYYLPSPINDAVHLKEIFLSL